MFSQSTRHQGVRKILERQLSLGRLSHAYLFMGPAGTGKKALALEFAQKVLEVDFKDLNRHPDFSELDSTSATAESVREFIARVALKPFLAKYKFALISGVENLNTQGANALLKTLEEPPENTVMVLTSSNLQVLPTVVSRCQVFHFGRSSRGKIQNRSALLELVGKPLTERLLAVNTFAELEEVELAQTIEEFVYQAAELLLNSPQKYPALAAALKAWEDLRTNKNRKLLLQGLLVKIL